MPIQANFKISRTSFALFVFVFVIYYFKFCIERLLEGVFNLESYILDFIFAEKVVIVQESRNF